MPPHSFSGLYMRLPRSARAALTGLTFLTAAGCHTGRAAREPLSTPQETLPVDHVILAIDTLERGIELLRHATGLTAVRGGEHPGRGTQNALIALGPGRYLELLAPNPADTSATARATAPARAAKFAQYRTLTPVGWAIHADDAAAERTRLLARGLPVSELRPGSRRRPDGRELSWTTFDPWSVERDVLPFVIAWSPTGPHPSRDAPAGCTLTAVHIVSPDADSLRARFADAGWPVPVTAGPAEQLRLDLSCPRGAVHFPDGT